MARWLEKRGFNLSEAQFDLRVSKQLLSVYLKGDGKPGRVNAQRLRNVAGITVGAWDAKPDPEQPEADEPPVETGDDLESETA